MAAGITPQGWVGTWSPGIGDPTIVGWITVVTYFTAAYLCWLAFKVERFRRGLPADGAGSFPHAVRSLVRGLLRPRRRPVPDVERVPSLWAGFCVLLLLLGINKQLDLQSLFTELGRIAAQQEGWYEGRRTVQVVFIVLLVLAGAGLLRALWVFARGHVHEVRLALFGAVGLVAFVAIRAASFHHVDLLIRTEVAGVDLNAWLENGAIACIGVAAARQIGVGRQPITPEYTPPPKKPAARL